MKKFVTLLFIMTCFATLSKAQTFLEHLQVKEPGKASVKVSQSKEIDELVNGKLKEQKVIPTKEVTHPQEKTNTHKKKDNVHTKNVHNKKDNVHKDKTIVHKVPEPKEHHEIENKEYKEKEINHKEKQQDNKPVVHPTTPIKTEKTTEHSKEEYHPKHETTPKTTDKHTNKEDTSDNEMEIPTIDMRKKVMRRSYKVTGYRVQAYAGSNSRADRLKAENAREHIKQILPNEPIYVHFYSPRWICRVGNYRSYGQAAHILKQIKALGYKQACIVRGKISVQY